MPLIEEARGIQIRNVRLCSLYGSPPNNQEIDERESGSEMRERGYKT